MNMGRDDSLLRQAIYTVVVFFGVFSFVYLGTFTAKVVSVDMTDKPQAAAVGASSFWCAVKNIFGFPCLEDTLKIEYAVLSPEATERERERGFPA